VELQPGGCAQQPRKAAAASEAGGVTGGSGGAGGGGGGMMGNAAALLSLLNPIAATGCGGLCLPATTGLLASVGSFLGLGVGGGARLVAYHPRSRSIRAGILNWLRFTYDVELGSAE
jgi:hypothetical protein